MSIITIIKKTARSLGIEIRRYVPASSDDARLSLLLKSHNIDLVLDIGANTGQYGKKIRSLGYRGNLISFEPLSMAHALLIKATEHDDSWTVAPRMAIGDRCGEISINISKNLYSSSVLPILPLHVKHAPESNYVSKETVPLRTLDSLMGTVISNGFKNIFLKIDVQGYEDQVLKGAENLLSTACGLQIELSFVELYNEQLLYLDIIHLMMSKGFALHSVMPEFFDKQGRLLQADGIFFK